MRSAPHMSAQRCGCQTRGQGPRSQGSSIVLREDHCTSLIEQIIQRRKVEDTIVVSRDGTPASNGKGAKKRK